MKENEDMFEANFENDCRDEMFKFIMKNIKEFTKNRPTCTDCLLDVLEEVFFSCIESEDELRKETVEEEVDDEEGVEFEHAVDKFKAMDFIRRLIDICYDDIPAKIGALETVKLDLHREHYDKNMGIESVLKTKNIINKVINNYDNIMPDDKGIFPGKNILN